MKPFLKWAGGKTRLVDRINEVLPKGKTFIEPFVGSGAVFLNTDYSEYVLSDSNPDLINLYNHLKSEGKEFIEYCKRYFLPLYNTEDNYYEVRNLFNTSSDTRLKSALFIYLNRHCFNGLCRYNSKGGFNVPFGRYKNPIFPEVQLSEFFHKSKKAIFQISDFRDTMDKAQKGDVVYCDPPYVPLSATSSFTDYSVGGFNVKDQLDLADMARKLQARGVHVVISNHNTEWTQQNYAPARLIAFDVQRFISSDIANRNKVSEILAVFE